MSDALICLAVLLDIPPRDLPMIWDADFMFGHPGADGTETYVLGEINVSSVFPIPDEAPREIARPSSGHSIGLRARSRTLNDQLHVIISDFLGVGDFKPGFGAAMLDEPPLRPAKPFAEVLQSGTLVIFTSL